MSISSPVSNKYDNATIDDDDLEDEQSPAVERRRSVREGEDAQLTELAAPRITPEQETGDDLEREESLARTETKGSDELAEIAAPEPVAHSASPQHRQSKDVSAEEKRSVEPVNTSNGLTVLRETTTVTWLILFSFLGTLARLGVEALSTYPYAVVPTTVLWANMSGSFLMGFLLEDRRFFRDTADLNVISDDKEETHRHIDRSKKTLPLYIGLTTGFCGSFTSFSTFITDAFLALTNELAPANSVSPFHIIDSASMESRSGGYSFMALLGILIIHPAVSIAALKTGAHLAVGLEQVTPCLPSRFIERFLDPLGIILGIGCWAGAVLLTVWPVHDYWRQRATMALVFAPLGTLMRFYLSRYLNARIPQFPLGTFASNIIGTCIEGMCYDLQHAHRIVGGSLSTAAVPCAVLEGMMQGFCGCSTTVSTWVVELNSLRRRHAWLYGSVSVAVALCLQIAIMGSVAWTVGFDKSCNA